MFAGGCVSHMFHDLDVPISPDFPSYSLGCSSLFHHFPSYVPPCSHHFIHFSHHFIHQFPTFSSIFHQIRHISWPFPPLWSHRDVPPPASAAPRATAALARRRAAWRRSRPAGCGRPPEAPESKLIRKLYGWILPLMVIPSIDSSH